LESRMSNYNFSNLSFIPGANETDGAEIFRYYTTCDGDMPEMVRMMQNPRELIGFNRNDSALFNPIEVLDDIQTAGLNVSDQLKENLLAFNVSMKGMFVAATDLGKKMMCDEAVKVWQPLVKTVCVEFNGALALTTLLYFLFAACLIPGVCIGVKGHKRFNTQNRNYHKKKKKKKKVDPDYDKKKKKKEKEKEEPKANNPSSVITDEVSYSESSSYSGSGSGSGSGSRSGSGSGSGSSSRTRSYTGSRSHKESGSGSDGLEDVQESMSYHSDSNASTSISGSGSSYSSSSNDG